MTVKVIHILGTVTTGGAEILLYNILQNWRDDAFQFSLYYTREYDGAKVPFEKIGLMPQPLHWESERDFMKILQLVRLFRRERPHIVHTHLWVGNYWIIIAARLAGVPIVIETIHDIFITTKRGGILHQIFRRVLFRWVDRTICVSKAGSDYMQKTYGHPENKITVIVNRCPIEAPVLPAEAMQKFSLLPQKSGNITILLAVGRLVPVKKGYEILLESIKLLIERGIFNFHLIISGGVMQDHPEFPDNLKNIVNTYGISKYITFKDVQWPELGCLYESADIFVMPSLYEGGPLTVLEAMRAGKPVIATRTGAVSEYVVEGETGIIVEPGNSAAFADAIQRLMTDMPIQKRMGVAGRDRFIKYFTIEKTVRELESLYYRLIQEKLHNGKTA